MIPNLFFDLSSPESVNGVVPVTAGTSSIAKDPSGSSFSDVINNIDNDPQATEIKEKNTSVSVGMSVHDGYFSGTAESQVSRETTAWEVTAAVRLSTEVEGDSLPLPASADPEFSWRDPSALTGSHHRPTGEHLPTGSHLLPTGNHLLPPGNRLPPTGQSLPVAERLSNQFGSDPVSIADVRKLDRQALMAAPATRSSIVDSADVARTTGQAQHPPAGETQIDAVQAPKLIRTRVDHALRESAAGGSGRSVLASRMSMTSPETLNDYAGRAQAAAARVEMSAAAVAATTAARAGVDGTTTGGVSAELSADSATARVTEDQVRNGPTLRGSVFREDRNVHVEAERFWRSATQMQNDTPREVSLSRAAPPSAVASAIAAMNMDPPSDMAPDVHLKSGDSAARRRQQPVGAVANPVVTALDTLDAQRVDVTVPRPELQMAPSDRPPAMPGGWLPPANAAETRASSNRANRSLAAAAAISSSEQPTAENSNATSLVGTDAARAENTWLRAELNGQSQQIGQQVARQILFAHNQNLSQMRMQLNPEELGQLDLRLRIEGDRVHVAIVAQHNGAREVLEAQLPQLRALLEEGGFELGDVDVRHQGGEGSRDRGAEPARNSPKTPVTEAEATSVGHSAAPPVQSGIIDAFA